MDPRGNQKAGTRNEREVEACPHRDMGAPAITGVRETGRRLASSPPRHTHLATQTLVTGGRSRR